MEEGKKKNKLIIFILYVLLFLSDVVIGATGLFFYKLSDFQVIRLLCFLFVADLFVIFSFKCSEFYRTLYIKNQNNYIHFYICFILMGLFSLICPIMPIASWPVVVIFVLLTLISNITTGIMSSLVCLVVAAAMGSTENMPYYLVYFLCGMVAALLLANIADDFKIGFPLVAIEILLISGLIIVSVTTTTQVSVELLIYPVINAAISLLLMLLVLKIYSARIIFSDADKYLEINDPECKLLSELRSCSPDDYYKSVHVAYFCDRIAKKLELDDNAVKCAGYYHRIGVVGGQRNWENTQLICSEQKLPDEVLNTLKQFLDKDAVITTPEAAVLYMSECIVSSVKYLFNKNKDISLDYPALINAIFKQRVETGIFEHCDISIKQFEIMKRVFVEEKLYYDFLR